MILSRPEHRHLATGVLFTALAATVLFGPMTVLPAGAAMATALSA